LAGEWSHKWLSLKAWTKRKIIVNTAMADDKHWPCQQIESDHHAWYSQDSSAAEVRQGQ